MDKKQIQLWDETTQKISKHVLLLAIAGMVASLFGMFLGTIADMANVCVIVGYAFLAVRLETLMALSDDADVAALTKVRLGILLFFLGVILKMIPVVGFVLGPLAWIAAYVFMLLGFSALKKSESFADNGGMSLLFIAAILGIVGSVFIIIPLVGKILGNLVFLAMYVLILLGWKKVTLPYGTVVAPKAEPAPEPAPEAKE